ncbi:MAG TPA: MBL fold metallo-hydrolase [Myxococcaceae bacterium]|jgi:hypothetical protein|nr:MBL fold metallo-hydrolase [Myxococcaceae bacterium]
MAPVSVTPARRRPSPGVLRCTLLGVGAMASPRFRPAGLLVECGSARVMIDGGLEAVPTSPPDAWLVTDARAELIADIRRRARAWGLLPGVEPFRAGALDVQPMPVRHTAHPTFGYRIRSGRRTVVWAPEFLVFPRWAAGADLVFAEASGWNRRIWFRGRVGGHASALEVAAAAERLGVGRLVLAHLGRPTLRALDLGLRPSFGEAGVEAASYTLGRSGTVRRSVVRA